MIHGLEKKTIPWNCNIPFTRTKNFKLCINSVKRVSLQKCSFQLFPIVLHTQPNTIRIRSIITKSHSTHYREQIVARPFKNHIVAPQWLTVVHTGLWHMTDQPAADALCHFRMVTFEWSRTFEDFKRIPPFCGPLVKVKATVIMIDRAAHNVAWLVEWNPHVCLSLMFEKFVRWRWHIFVSRRLHCVKSDFTTIYFRNANVACYHIDEALIALSYFQKIIFFPFIVWFASIIWDFVFCDWYFLSQSSH